MAFKFVALLVISAQICSTLTEAACACTREFRPLCGSDGVTYSNPCLLRCAASTSGREIKIVKYGPCEESRKSCVCPDVLSPVCATDGQTYDNQCIMSCEANKVKKSLKVKHSGSCKSRRESQDCVCTFIYSPVCGNNGITYGNECALNCAAKVNPLIKLSHNGPCK